MGSLNPVFSVDLAYNGKNIPVHSLEICVYNQTDLEEELALFGVKTPKGLTDFDRMVFTDEDEAEEFLTQYKRFMHILKTTPVCVSRGLPTMAYRTRHLVLGLMGLKLKTSRTYNKGWAPGQLFNLYDRKHFLTVRLLKTVQTGPSEWEYFFEMLS